MKSRSSATWVLPNRNTIGLVAVLAGMWWAGVSQTNGAAYLLCFVLAGVSAVSVLHTWANLKGVTLEADPVQPVFAGEPLSVRIHASSERRRVHFGIRVSPVEDGLDAMFPKVLQEVSTGAELTVNAPRRGVFPGVRVQLESRYPLGFFSAKRHLEIPAPHYVYPAPAGSKPLPFSPSLARNARDGSRMGGDDFGGVREWRTGESQRHIDWKAAARGQPLLTKQWFGDADENVLLEWQQLAGLDTEARLSQLARWISQAERAGVQYGLRLPGASKTAGRGEAHFHACLRLLAEFTSDSEAPSRTGA